jgi:hypothetical protein
MFMEGVFMGGGGEFHGRDGHECMSLLLAKICITLKRSKGKGGI